MPDPWKPFREARLAREAAAREAAARAEEEAAQVQAELEKIRGQDGRDGIDGQDGKDGRDGRDGVDGKDGKDGAPGRDGLDGKDGKDGKDGAPGPTVVRSEFQRDTSQRIAAVIEYLSDGTERVFHVQRDSAGRPVELT